MIFLFLSILTNAALYWLFKYFERIEAKIFETIVFNYVVAFCCGIFFVSDLKSATTSALQLPTWSIAGMAMGALFIAVFYFTAITAKKTGIALATLSSKISLVLAVLLLAFVGKGEITWITTSALFIAISGLYFFSIDGKTAFKWSMLSYPGLLLIGSAAVDFSIAFFQDFTANENERSLFTCLPFLVAGIIGIVVMTYDFIVRKKPFPKRELLTGLVLGLVNYASIFFLIEMYSAGWLPEHVILPVNNLGVVIFSAIGAIWFFSENLTRRKIQGLTLCLIALLLLLL
jgi:drug/metabolite transporter (DMT)-like permease